MKKRLLALLLAVCMVLTLMPTMAFADDSQAKENTSLAGTVSPAVIATINGVGYDGLNAALAAVKDGETIVLAAGEYACTDAQAITNTSGKTFTIEGVGEASVVYVGDGTTYGSDGPCDYRLQGASVTFKNLTVKETCGNANYQGFVRPEKLTFENCTFYGRTTYWSNDCTINGCTFNQTDAYDYCLWTWGCEKMTITNTTFNTQGKAIKMYGKGSTNLSVEGCTFISNGEHAGADKPAIAINTGDYETDYNLEINDCTQTGFVVGATGSALYGSDKASEVGGNLDVTIDGTPVWEDGEVYSAPVASVNGVEYGKLDKAIEAAIGTEYAVEIFADIDLTDKTWTAVDYAGGTLTINGNGHTIKGMTDSLLNKTGSGGHELAINDLTFYRANISTSSDYAAVICPYADCMTSLTFKNVSITSCTVTGNKYAAAFIGYAGGWDQEGDGAVLQHVTFDNCTVDRCSITGGGSCGALIGHAAGNPNTCVTVTATDVTANAITSTGESTNKAGSLFGTVGCAGGEDTGLFVDANVSYNVVRSSTTEITTIYGRQGNSTGTVVVTGGSYDSRPIAQEDSAWATVAEDYQLVENNGTYSVTPLPAVAKIGNTEYNNLEKALEAAQSGDTVEILASQAELTNIKEGVTYIGLVDENGKPATTVSAISGASKNLTLKNFDFNCSVFYFGDVQGTTLDNCKFSGNRNALRSLYLNDGGVFTLNNCEFAQTGQYAIHFDSGDGSVVVNDCVIRGTVAIGSSISDISFNNCTFAGKNDAGKCNINIYNKAQFNSCTFAADYVSGSSRGILMLNEDNKTLVTMNNCTTVEGSIKDVFRTDYLQGVGAIDATVNENGEYTGGTFVAGDASYINCAKDSHAVIDENGTFCIAFKQYYVTGATIGYGFIDDNGVITESKTATIVAPAANFRDQLVVTGQPLEACVTGDLDIGDAQIVYYEKGSDTALESAPVEAGTYVAKLTFGGVTAELEFTVELLIPDAPVVTASNTASTGKVVVKWSAVDGAVKYKVYRATSKNGTYSLISTTTSTKVTNSKNVTVGKCYYYYVVAVGYGGGESVQSNIVSRRVDCAAPVVTTSSVNGKIKVVWGSVVGAQKYEVYRATSRNGNYTKIATTTKTSLTNSSVKAGKNYYYKVKAIASSSSYANSAFSSIVCQTCVLVKPTVSISITKAGHPRLEWSAVTGADKYEVYRATSKNGKYTKIFSTTGTARTDPSAKAGTTYYYKVKAVCSSNTAANSAYSTIVSAKAK